MSAHRKEISPSILIVGTIILYIEDSKDDTNNLLQLINTSNKVARYKINTQISLVSYLQPQQERNQRNDYSHNSF